MGFYKDRESYFREFAEKHYQVKHNKPVSDDDTTPRESFFRINDEEELMAACTNWAHFPCVVMIGLQGGLINKNDSIRQGNINTTMFLQKLTLDPANPIDATAKTEAYESSFEVMKDLLAMMNEEYEENDTCGNFHDLDLGKAKWEQCGPVGDGLYGWILVFSDEMKGSAVLKYNPSHFI